MAFKDPERAREYGRRYREENRERLAARAQARYQQNKVRADEQARRWKAENPERYAELVRNWMLRKRYGIEPEDYTAMLEAQGGLCAVCRQTERDPRRKFLSVDHDHETGTVRGLLCHSCNVAIGHLDDDPDLMLAAAFYVLKSRDVLALDKAISS